VDGISLSLEERSVVMEDRNVVVKNESVVLEDRNVVVGAGLPAGYMLMTV
jgi:hypothetical protein